MVNPTIPLSDDFSDQFRKLIIRHKRIGYNMNVMRQTACLVVNPKLLLIIIIRIIILFQVDNIFGTNASLTYGPQIQRHTCV